MTVKTICMYASVQNEFALRGCQLLSTEEEYESQKLNQNKKYKYVASCGDEHVVFYNVFKNTYKFDYDNVDRERLLALIA